jgi:hypothetical protein
LLQYNDEDEVFGTNLRFSWLKSAKSSLYIVYNEVDESGVDALPRGRELTIKYSYIFDLLR